MTDAKPKLSAGRCAEIVRLTDAEEARNEDGHLLVLAGSARNKCWIDYGAMEDPDECFAAVIEEMRR